LYQTEIRQFPAPKEKKRARERKGIASGKGGKRDEKKCIKKRADWGGSLREQKTDRLWERRDRGKGSKEKGEMADGLEIGAAFGGLFREPQKTLSKRKRTRKRTEKSFR